jgi:hypothetical protein
MNEKFIQIHFLDNIISYKISFHDKRLYLIKTIDCDEIEHKCRQ